MQSSIVRAARYGLAELADPAKAPGMRRYMRSAMPFLGVQRPARKELVRRLLADHPLDRAGFEAAVRALWDGAEYRATASQVIALKNLNLGRYQVALIDSFQPRSWAGAENLAPPELNAPESSGPGSTQDGTALPERGGGS